MLTITARTEAIGMHHWPGAPERRAYLRDLHRHVFKVAATVVVSHGDRETEFHDLASELAQDVYAIADGAGPGSDSYLFGARSVEMLATELAERLEARGYAVVQVTVSEDGQHDGTWWAPGFTLVLPG